MWTLGGRELKSRLLLGTAKYPSPALLCEAITRSGAQVVTVSLRRLEPGPEARSQAFWELIRATKAHILPNTAGCRSADEAILTARLARELFSTNWIKLETVGDEQTLQPDPFALVEAARTLIAEGFEVFPYMTEDLVVAERLVAAGCRILMPWGSPIGSGQGLAQPAALRTLRSRFGLLTLIVDAGLGAPSHAAQAMEMGFDGVLLNTAVSLAREPARMAEAFAGAVHAGRLGFEAGLIPARSFAQASTPSLGTPFWHERPGS